MIASLNGMTHASWVEYARGLQEADADAIELNVYFIPADLALTGDAVERHYLEIVAAVKAAVTIRVAVKISPYFSTIGAMVRALPTEVPTQWCCSTAFTSLTSTSRISAC